MPTILREIVHSIVADQPDVEIVAEMQEPRDLALAMQVSRPDVLILGGAEGEDRNARVELLYAHPRLKVLEVSTSGREAFLHELVPRCTPLGELSPDELLKAVRQRN